MKDEDLDLKRYQELWAKTKAQVGQAPYFSREEILKLIHSKHLIQLRRRHRTKWVEFSVVLLLLLLALCGENVMLNVGNNHGIILLALVSVLLLMVLLFLGYELYLFQRIHRLRYQTSKMEPYSERLEKITQRRWQRYQMLVNTTNPIKAHIYWGRISGVVASVLLLIGGGIYFVASSNSERALKSCTYCADIPNDIQLEEVLSNNRNCDVAEYYRITETHLQSIGQTSITERR